MVKKQLLFIGLFILIVATGCSQSIDKQIIGTWKAIDDECDPTISDIGSEVTFYDDDTIVGIEGFKNYKIEETDSEDYDYAVLSGGYEDTTKFRVNISKDNNLKIIKDEYDENFDTIRSCHMEKASD